MDIKAGVAQRQSTVLPSQVSRFQNSPPAPTREKYV